MDTCSRCGKELEKSKYEFTTGYGTDDKGNKVCYAYCALEDQKWMQEHGKITLYYSDGKVCNWPGSLEYKPYYIHVGKHNIARTQTHFWFNDELGHKWHGVQYGDFSELATCKRIKDDKK